MLAKLRQILCRTRRPQRMDIAFIYTPALNGNDVRTVMSALEDSGVIVTHLGNSDPPPKWSGSLSEAASLFTAADKVWNSIFGRDHVRQFEFGVQIHND